MMTNVSFCFVFCSFLYVVNVSKLSNRMIRLFFLLAKITFRNLHDRFANRNRIEKRVKVPNYHAQI